MIPTRWHSEGQESPIFILVAFGIGMFAIFQINAAAALIVLGVVLIFAFLGLSIFDKRGTLYQIVPYDARMVQQIIENVLLQKGLPFIRVDQVLLMQKTGVSVHIRDMLGQPPTTRIVITPYNGDTKLLISSLCQKIDDAFLPQGLLLHASSFFESKGL